MAQPLNILCFGDSLTAGYSSWGLVFTPYSAVLKSSLETHFGDTMNININTDGVSGELVLQGFKARMKRHCKRGSSPTSASATSSQLHSSSTKSTSKLKKMFFSVKGESGEEKGKISSFASRLRAKGITPPEKQVPVAGTMAEHSLKTDGNQYTNEQPYDWVIFLGGTNDLGRGMPVDEIYSEIKSVTQIPLDEGARVLIMTVPECHAKSYSLDKRRDDLNALIKNDKRENVYNLDLRTLLPYHSMPPDERDLIWDDGLHFKPAGYARIGAFVASALISIMDPSTTSLPSSSSQSTPLPPSSSSTEVHETKSSTSISNPIIAEAGGQRHVGEVDEDWAFMKTKQGEEKAEKEKERESENENGKETEEEQKRNAHGPFSGMFGAHPPSIGGSEA